MSEVKVTATKGSGAPYCIGWPSGAACGTITIGGTQYYNGATWTNVSLENELKAETFIYQPTPTQ